MDTIDVNHAEKNVTQSSVDMQEMSNVVSKNSNNKKRNSECLSDYDSISSKISKTKQNMNKKTEQRMFIG